MRAYDFLRSILCLFTVSRVSDCFTVIRSCQHTSRRLPVTVLHFEKPKSVTPSVKENNILTASTIFAAVVYLTATGTFGNFPAYADEYGVEKEAPTVFTGETVMICKRRGPLGACLETTIRTDENDNDLAKKYFRAPTELQKEKEAAMRVASDEGNALISKLRQQSEQNRAKNDLYVQSKTFENDQSATFGPFDRQVLIMNTDGRTFTILQNPQAMRLKEGGFIEDRKVVKQPTEEELEKALQADGSGLAGVIQSIFDGSSE